MCSITYYLTIFAVPKRVIWNKIRVVYNILKKVYELHTYAHVKSTYGKWRNDCTEISDCRLLAV